MAKKAKVSEDNDVSVLAKEADQLAKDLGIKTANIHAVKVIIETGEGQKIIVDPLQCSASVMKGMEEYGISFNLSGKVIEGKIEFK